MDRTEKYIRELKSSTSLMRKFAARYLKNDGDERAIEPLVGALSDEHPEVRKEAAETLGHLGDTSVIEALKNGLKDEDAQVVRAAEAALKRIEERFPATPKAPTPPRAERWWAPEEKPDREGLVRAALSGVDGESRKRAYGYKITLHLLNGRRQTVRLVYDKSDPDDDPILLLFTICGEADREKYHWALKANARLPYGALAVRTVKDREQLILIDTMLEADTTADELRKTLLTIAEKGDLIERKMYGKDDF